MKGSSSKEIEHKFNEIKEMYLKNRQKQVEIGHNVEERLRSEEEYIQELKEQDKNERIKKLIEVFG